MATPPIQAAGNRRDGHCRRAAQVAIPATAAPPDAAPAPYVLRAKADHMLLSAPLDAASLDSAVTVLVAAFLGAAIGAEREWRRHPGGLRSCVLVAAASAVFARIAIIHGGNSPAPALGAIATGIGFLGAGVILRHGTQVRGLSTAATFWAVAAVGASAGLQEFILAVALTAVVFFAHVALRWLSLWIERHAPPYG
jgi:putative Mg2+ transporter-C (MgtC) family protein